MSYHFVLSKTWLCFSLHYHTTFCILTEPILHILVSSGIFAGTLWQLLNSASFGDLSGAWSADPGLCGVRSLVPAECGAWSPRSAEHCLRGVQSLVSVECGAWSLQSVEHGLREVWSMERSVESISVECRAWSPQSAEPGLCGVQSMVPTKCRARQNFPFRFVHKVQSMVPPLQSVESGLHRVHSSMKCGWCSATCGTSQNYPCFFVS